MGRYFYVINYGEFCAVGLALDNGSRVERYEHKEYVNMSFKDATNKVKDLEEIYSEGIQRAEYLQDWNVLPFCLKDWELIG